MRRRQSFFNPWNRHQISQSPTGFSRPATRICDRSTRRGRSEGDDLYGDGANIAARIEALADARAAGQEHRPPGAGYPVRDLNTVCTLSLRVSSALPIPDKPSVAAFPVSYRWLAAAPGRLGRTDRRRKFGEGHRDCAGLVAGAISQS
jgi:hypothetical protein